jgi:hypothetical protein
MRQDDLANFVSNSFEVGPMKTNAKVNRYFYIGSTKFLLAHFLLMS